MANVAVFQSGKGSIIINNTKVTITMPYSFADNNYSVALTSTSGNNLFTIDPNSKTTTQFSVILNPANNMLAANNFDWIAIKN